MAFTAALLFICGPIWHRRWYFSATQRFRRELGDPEGWLDRHDYDTEAGPEALRRDGEHREPRTAGQGLPVTRFGFSPGTLVSGAREVRGRAVYAPWPRAVGIFGPQDSGKTQLLIPMVLDSPAATFAATTKPELVVATRRLREQVGPTALFNPLERGGLEHSCGFDPVAGCADSGTAGRRAASLVRGAGGAAGIDRANFWAGKAAEVLRYYLCAAALGDLDMTAVAHWVNNPDGDPTPLAVLEQRPAAPAGWHQELRSILGTIKDTRDGYFSTATSAVAFMDIPAVRDACRPGPGQAFDVASFLAARGTLYAIGDSKDTRLAPLYTALTEHLFDTAQAIAAPLTGNRLPEPLNMLLDEVAHMTPVPLHEWLGDSRGWGITVVPVVQSRAQFDSTWGRDNGKTIWDNLPTKIVLPKVADTDMLRDLSYLAGERLVRQRTEGSNHHGAGLFSGGGGTSISEQIVREPVISGPSIAGMPRWHAFVLGLSRHPAVLRYEPGYQRVARDTAALDRAQAAGPRDSQTRDARTRR